MKRFFTLLCLFALVSLMLSAVYLDVVSAQTATPEVTAEPTPTPIYMVLYQGAAGFNFWCTSQNPYTIIAPQSEEQYEPYAAEPEELQLIYQVVEVEYCNVDNVYAADDNTYPLFAWRFDYRVTDGHESHRHFTRGAYWVRSLNFQDLTP